jgi:hypothetical protein
MPQLPSWSGALTRLICYHCPTLCCLLKRLLFLHASLPPAVIFISFLGIQVLLLLTAFHLLFTTMFVPAHPFFRVTAKLRKVTIGFVMVLRPCGRPSIRPTAVRMEQLVSHWTAFREILCWKVVIKSVDNIQVLLKSNTNSIDLYFTWRLTYIYIHLVTSVTTVAVDSNRQHQRIYSCRLHDAWLRGGGHAILIFNSYWLCLRLRNMVCIRYAWIYIQLFLRQQLQNISPWWRLEVMWGRQI